MMETIILKTLFERTVDRIFSHCITSLKENVILFFSVSTLTVAFFEVYVVKITVHAR